MSAVQDEPARHTSVRKTLYALLAMSNLKCDFFSRLRLANDSKDQSKEGRTGYIVQLAQCCLIGRSDPNN